MDSITKAQEIAKEMILQRGYLIVEEEPGRILATVPEGYQLAVFLSDNSKISVNDMKEFVSAMNELEIEHVIIVYKEDVTTQARQFIEKQEKYIMELFAEEDLQYNITKHRLQPAFEKLGNEEALALKQQFGLKFPTLKREDPIAKFYFYQKGDVIKITRSNGYVTYRIVR